MQCEETFALLNLLVEVIEADRYPLSPCIRRRQVLAKFGELGEHRCRSSSTVPWRARRRSTLAHVQMRQTLVPACT